MVNDDDAHDSILELNWVSIHREFLTYQVN